MWEASAGGTQEKAKRCKRKVNNLGETSSSVATGAIEIIDVDADDASGGSSSVSSLKAEPSRSTWGSAALLSGGGAAVCTIV